MNTRPKSTSDIQLNDDDLDSSSKFKLGRLSYYEYKSCPTDSQDADLETFGLERANVRENGDNSNHIGEGLFDRNGENGTPGRVRSVTNIIINNSGNDEANSVDIVQANTPINTINGPANRVNHSYPHHSVSPENGILNSSECLHVNLIEVGNDVNLTGEESVHSNKPCQPIDVVNNVSTITSKTNVIAANVICDKPYESNTNDNDSIAMFKPDIEADVKNCPESLAKVCTSNAHSSGANMIYLSCSDNEESASSSLGDNIAQSSTYQNFDGYLSDEDDDDNSFLGIVNPAVDNTGCETDEAAADEVDDKVASRIDIHQLNKTHSDRKHSGKRKESFEQKLRRRFTIKDEHTSAVTKRILASVNKYSLFVFNFCSWVS